MGFFRTVRRWIDMLFRNSATEQFDVYDVISAEMRAVLKNCADIYKGSPSWVDPDNRIRTVNFSKSICSEVARLAMLGTKITVDGSARAEWLQEQINGVYFKLRSWVEYGCAYGTVIIKPTGDTFDVFTPEEFIVTEKDKNGISGVVFFDRYADGKQWYTRMEYHRFVPSTMEGASISPYYISNRTYVSKSENSIGDPIAIGKTKWADLMEDSPPILKANGEKLDGQLFGVLCMPQANNVDITSPLGLPIFMDAIEELKDLDIAYSRNAGEIFDSEKIVFLDDRLMSNTAPGKERVTENGKKLPHYVYNLFGQQAAEFYQEINPALNTNERLLGINSILSQIGYKCGFSNGYFVFSQKSGMVTATQVESDDRRTIQLIKDIRDSIESALDGAIYALSVIADLYKLAPVGAYKITYDFGDITYNREEDRLRWWGYVQSGKIPTWVYFNKFEGMSEEAAKAIVAEAQQQEVAGLFEEE